MSVKQTQEIETYRESLPDGLEIELIRVGKGSFGRDEVQVNVPDFFLGKYPVTNQEYLSFVKETNSHRPEWMEEGSKYNIYTGTEDHYQGLGEALINDHHPVIGVSWHNAVAYCKWLGQHSGKTYRLPSETEWEFAARGGCQSMSFRYAGSNKLKEVGWYNVNSHRTTKPVGLKLSNELNLHDMSGNVWEWCADHWHESYDGAPTDGSPWVTGGDSNIRVVRGGSWYDNGDDCTVSNRDGFNTDLRSFNVGFRLARY